MNIQAIMKLQKEMMKTKEEIDNTIFTGNKSFVNVKVNGKKDIVEIKIDKTDFSNDDVEMLEDLIMLSINDAFAQVDKITEEKLGKYTKGLPGMF